MKISRAWLDIYCLSVSYHAAIAILLVSTPIAARDLNLHDIKILQLERLNSPISETIPGLLSQAGVSLSLPELPPLGDDSSYIPEVPLTDAANNYLLLDLGERRVYIYREGEIRASYPVAIGQAGWETPVGVFEVENMEYYPIWRNPSTGEVIPAGNDNPLGVAWIGFWSDGTRQVGFHGTPNPSLLGQAVSHGCVRMHNRDVLQLFEQVHIGITVKVVE